jgi:hypothetical protein
MCEAAHDPCTRASRSTGGLVLALLSASHGELVRGLLGRIAFLELARQVLTPLYRL